VHLVGHLRIAVRDLVMAYFNVPSKDILEGSWDEKEKRNITDLNKLIMLLLCELFLVVHNCISN
jgi:hypothetical protein